MGGYEAGEVAAAMAIQSLRSYLLGQPMFAALAGKALQDLGYKDVRNLGAFKEWAENGGAVERA